MVQVRVLDEVTGLMEELMQQFMAAMALHGVTVLLRAVATPLERMPYFKFELSAVDPQEFDRAERWLEAHKCTFKVLQAA